MNLASFYLCLLKNINTPLVGKEDNYKYLVALYTHHFKELFTFSVFFFFFQVRFWAIYDKKLKLSFILGYFL